MAWAWLSNLRDSVKHFQTVRKLPSPPKGLRWVPFSTAPVAFLIPADFAMHREQDDTVAVYLAGDSGVTLRFSLHSRLFKAELPPDVAVQFVANAASESSLSLTRLNELIYLTESEEREGLGRMILMHYWKIGRGRILVVASATVWGADREAKTVQRTLSVVPQIIESIRLAR